jgi:hypothetical protein
MSKVVVEHSCDDSVFVTDMNGDVYIRIEVSDNVYYVLLDDGSVFCDEEVTFQIRPLPIGSVIKITV